MFSLAPGASSELIFLAQVVTVTVTKKKTISGHHKISHRPELRKELHMLATANRPEQAQLSTTTSSMPRLAPSLSAHLGTHSCDEEHSAPSPVQRAPPMMATATVLTPCTLDDASDDTGRHSALPPASQTRAVPYHMHLLQRR
ncbi:hypothetical protein EDB83DRAFT_2324354 [Lactarius deliciosus]|nr:hypothetical protein EDB83DRAFT_2324354 [Lactarius deliciosus]